MSLKSLLKRKADAASAQPDVPDEVGPVHDARVRARRRLIGAVVLLAAGMVLFPWLFESKPRSLPLDIAIDVARKDSAALPKPVPVGPRAAKPAPPPDAGTEAPSAVVPEPGPSKLEASAPVPQPSAPAAVVAAAKAPAPTPAATPQVAASSPAASASASTGRFVVQVGAFNEATALREARSKVEKLGLKTYTQVIETASGARTRVRVGPFETRDEADRASARLKAAGLPAYILVL